MRQHLRKCSYIIVFKILIAVGCDGGSGRAPAIAAPSAGSSRLSELLRDDMQAGFPKATRVREFGFPLDHGPHPEYRNEWWYFTGNLDAETGGRFGFELTIFRFSLSAQAPEAAESAWRTNQVFIGHLAVTDAENRRFHVAQRYSRGAAGLAGATAMPAHIWLDDWSISTDEDTLWQLRASDEEFAIALDLEPLKAVVLNGDRGLSQKSAEPGNASYYYSVPRLATRGVITVDGDDVAVSGLSWLDREWGSSALARDQKGWDWFALQLSDGSDLMYYVLRGANDAPDPHSSGTRINAEGTATGLGLDDVSITVTDYWESERGGRYPSGWEIDVPGEALSLRVTPILDDQELVTNVRYWEGAVDVVGTSNGSPINGRGYVELTGYASE